MEDHFEMPVSGKLITCEWIEKVTALVAKHGFCPEGFSSLGREGAGQQFNAYAVVRRARQQNKSGGS
jgi:hypothetical protein